MNLFRSDEHVRRWPLYYRTGNDDYVMPVSEWDTVFSAPIFRNRLEPDYLAHADEYGQGYRSAFEAAGKAMPAPDRVLMTVLFTDIVDSTRRAASEGDGAWISLLERHDRIVREQLAHFQGREVKHTGDGFLACFDSPARAIRCGAAIREAVRSLGIEARAGVHLGECEQRGDDLGGIAVHIGARIGALAAPSEVLVSRTVLEAVTGSGIDFEDRGVHPLKGVPGEWAIHAALV